MANTSATIKDVNDFLTQMKLCLTMLGGHVFYNTREKNKQLIAQMDWYKEDQKKEWLLKLEAGDYYEGPDANEQPGLSSVWKFGKRIKGHLCYIKIFLQKPNVVCISFHLAEHDMYLPLKNITERA